MEAAWHLIADPASLDTPLMAVYPDRIRENIRLALAVAGSDASRLRPHIKTHKTAEILQLFLEQGITKVKCATIAEAELAASAGMPDVLLAYQPVGSKVERLLKLVGSFPDTRFSCLFDNLSSAARLGSQALAVSGKPVAALIDLNTGMNRTGYPFEQSLAAFYQAVAGVQGLDLLGLHIYDGHLHHPDPAVRAGWVSEVMATVQQEMGLIRESGLPGPLLVAGGSNTFSAYASYPEVECSPGTFVFWDKNYTDKIPELDFKPAAVLVATVISRPAKDTLCLDLGYKAVSAENPLDKRVFFAWNPDLEPIAHSEEHLVVRSNRAESYRIGDVVYAIPYHVCPSVALYDELAAVQDQKINANWQVTARRRKICL